MKRSILPILSITALSLMGTILLTINADIWVSLLCASAMVVAVVFFIVYETPSMFFVTIFFINYVMFVDGGGYSTTILLGTLCLVSPFFLFLKKPERLLPLWLPILLVLFYYFIVALLKPYPLKGYWIVLHIEALAIFILTQFFSWNTEKIANISKLHMIALAVFGIIEVTFFYKSRIRGPMMSATVYADLLVIVWATWFSYELLNAKFRYLRVAIYTILVIAVIIATGTRMAIIAMVISFALTLFARVFILGQDSVHKKLMKIGIYGIAAALLLVYAWTLLPNDLTIKKNFQSLLQGQVDFSNLGRFFAWYCAIQAFKSSPLLGIGNGNFMQFIQQNYANSPIPEVFLTLPHAHNATLAILCENGIIGIIIALIIVGMALLQLLRHAMQPSTPRSVYCLFIGFAVMYIISMIGEAIPYYPSSMAWIAWLLGAFMRLPAERKDSAV